MRSLTTLLQLPCVVLLSSSVSLSDTPTDTRFFRSLVSLSELCKSRPHLQRLLN